MAGKAAGPAPSLTLADAKALAAETAAAGRAPEYLERSAAVALAAASALRGRRGSPDDPHELDHLAAIAAAGDYGHCRAGGCTLAVRRYEDRLAIHLDGPGPAATGDWPAGRMAKSADAPEDLEREAGRCLVAAYIMRDRRANSADAHARRHLMAAIEVGNSGRCRGSRCVLAVRRPAGRYILDFDVPWDERSSDFRLN